MPSQHRLKNLLQDLCTLTKDRVITGQTNGSVLPIFNAQQSHHAVLNETPSQSDAHSCTGAPTPQY